MKFDWQKWTLGTAFVIGIIAVSWQTDRSNFGFITAFYTLAFAAYFGLQKYQSKKDFLFLACIAVIGHATALLFDPHLSNDFYRFLWDGELVWSGMNPFDAKPNDLVEAGYNSSSYLNELHVGMGELSAKNYTCYPPGNQLYFILATAFSDEIATNLIVMKLLIILTEFIGAIYLYKLLVHFKLHVSRMWMLFLNPLWIIECTGNVHFEGVMISWLLVAFYFLFTQRLVLGSIFFAFAVHTKLIPLLLLPFFFRFFGFQKSVKFYALTIITVLLAFMTQLNTQNAANFFESLALYFRVFEFNSFIFYNTMEVSRMKYGFYMSKTWGPMLSKLSLAIIVFLSLYKGIDDWKSLFLRMLTAYFVYLLLSSTLHPWYVLPLLTLSLFTNYSFPAFWSYLIFFSYFFYSIGNGKSFEVRTMVSIEYLLLFGLVYLEWRQKGSLFSFLRLTHTSSKVT